MTIDRIIQQKLKFLKPHLGEQFEIELTTQAYDVANPRIRQQLLSEMKESARRNRCGLDIEHWRENVIASMYPSSIFQGPRGDRLLFNSEPKDLIESRNALGSVVCHELLHEVFRGRFVQGMIDELDFVTYPLLSEGFSEYGSLDIFTTLYPLERSGITKRKENIIALASEYQTESEKRIPLEKDSSQRRWERLTDYDAHTLEYIFFRDHLGENANLKTFIDLTVEISREQREEFQQRTGLFLRKYV